MQHRRGTQPPTRNSKVSITTNLRLTSKKTSGRRWSARRTSSRTTRRPSKLTASFRKVSKCTPPHKLPVDEVHESHKDLHPQAQHLKLRDVQKTPRPHNAHGVLLDRKYKRVSTAPPSRRTGQTSGRPETSDFQTDTRRPPGKSQRPVQGVQEVRRRRCPSVPPRGNPRKPQSPPTSRRPSNRSGGRSQSLSAQRQQSRAGRCPALRWPPRKLDEKL